MMCYVQIFVTIYNSMKAKPNSIWIWIVIKKKKMLNGPRTNRNEGVGIANL